MVRERENGGKEGSKFSLRCLEAEGLVKVQYCPMTVSQPPAAVKAIEGVGAQLFYSQLHRREISSSHK
jgi:hypothetical protein